MTSSTSENAKSIAFCLWLKLNQQRPISVRSALTEEDLVPLYDDPLY